MRKRMNVKLFILHQIRHFYLLGNYLGVTNESSGRKGLCHRNCAILQKFRKFGTITNFDGKSIFRTKSFHLFKWQLQQNWRAKNMPVVVGRFLEHSFQQNKIYQMQLETFASSIKLFEFLILEERSSWVPISWRLSNKFMVKSFE